MKLDKAVKDQLGLMLAEDDAHSEQMPESEVSYLLRAFLVLINAYLRRVEPSGPEAPLRNTMATQG